MTKRSTTNRIRCHNLAVVRFDRVFTEVRTSWLWVEVHAREMEHPVLHLGCLGCWERADRQRGADEICQLHGNIDRWKWQCFLLQKTFKTHPNNLFGFRCKAQRKTMVPFYQNHCILPITWRFLAQCKISKLSSPLTDLLSFFSGFWMVSNIAWTFLLLSGLKHNSVFSWPDIMNQ